MQVRKLFQALVLGGVALTAAYCGGGADSAPPPPPSPVGSLDDGGTLPDGGMPDAGMPDGGDAGSGGPRSW